MRKMADDWLAFFGWFEGSEEAWAFSVGLSIIAKHEAVTKEVVPVLGKTPSTGHLIKSCGPSPRH